MTKHASPSNNLFLKINFYFKLKISICDIYSIEFVTLILLNIII